MKKRRMTHVAVAVTACAFMAGASIALADDNSTNQALAGASIAPAQVATKAAASGPPSLDRARSMFSVLNGRTAVPPKILHASLPVEELGLDLAETVRVPAPKDDAWADSWYVVPGSEGVCLAMIEGVVCSTFADIEKNGMVWMLGPSKSASDVPAGAAPAMTGWQVRALLPDTNSSLTVSGLNRGVTGTGRPQNNVLNLLLPRGGDSYAVRDQAGKVVHEESVIGGVAVH